MSKSAKHHFKTFPEFSRLTLADKEAYEELIADYPPCAAFSFSSLMTWWNQFEGPRIAHYGENIIISLWYPGYDDFCGLTVLGQKDIDETFCAVFDFQKNTGREVKLSRVPEFVIKEVKYPDLFRLESKREHDECILDVEKFLEISDYSSPQRSRIRRFLAEFDEKDIETKILDLSNPYENDRIMNLIDEWKNLGGFNSLMKHEEDSIKDSVKHALELGYTCVGLCVRGKLHSFILVQDTSDPSQQTIEYIRLSYEIPYLLEVAVFYYAKWFMSKGIKAVNIESDFGDDFLRSVKVNIGPSNFNRMYTVLPRSSKTKNSLGTE